MAKPTKTKDTETIIPGDINTDTNITDTTIPTIPDPNTQPPNPSSDDIGNVEIVEEIKLDGKILGIGVNATIWKSSSSRIELNRFAGMIAVKLPSDLTPSETMEIRRGIEVGRVELADEVKSIEPVNPSYNDLSNLHSVNIFLDEKKLTVFESNVRKTPSQSFLSLCLSTEESDRNRDEYKTILKEKLNTLS